MAKKLKFKKKKVKEGEGIKENKKQFPRISRFIPDKSKESYIFFIALIFILISSLIVGLDLFQNIQLENRLIGQSSDLQKKQVFWERQIEKHPDFRDAYFNLALVDYQLRDFDSARKNLDKALNIDPNFKQGIEFKKILTGSL